MQKMRWTGVVLRCVFGLGIMKSMDGALTRAEGILAEERPIVIAHRGYSEIAPENTLTAFEWGVKSGADLVELDYHVSDEGTEIVIHDVTLDRTTDAVERWGEERLLVSERGLKAMQGLDAGSWFGEGFAGERLPTLVEAIELIQGRGGMTLVERKAGSADSMAGILKEHGWVNELVVQSFDWEYLRRLHELVPEQVLGALGPGKERDGVLLSRAERELSEAWVDEAKRTGARVIGWNRWVSEAAIRYAHEQGLEVWIYTINDLEEAQALLRAGVDGIITNNPSLIWKAVARLE
jgi:glycerophosphoryl diester phosphodiesterase